MKRIVPVVLALLTGLSQALATQDGYSIGLNFGADEYPESPDAGTLQPTDVAGVPGVKQANWNNLRLATGGPETLTADNQGNAVATSATVEWSCPNTWSTTGRGEENNGFPAGPDRRLMIGYLDTGNATTTTITISGLPAELTSGYDVYVYCLGGVSGRGGAVRIVNPATGAVLRDYKQITAVANPNAFIEDRGADHTDTGNYLHFTALREASIRIEATTEQFPFGGAPRAPVNAVQLVAAAITDTTPPSVPQNLKADRTGAISVALSWDPSTDDSGAVTYRVDRNGTVIASGLTTPSYTDTSVAPSTSYTYKVDAGDSSGNRSAFSSPLTVTTAAEVANPGFLSGRIFRFNSSGGAFIGAQDFRIDEVLADPKWPNNPDQRIYLNGLSYGDPNFGNTLGENYMIAISGTLTVPETGSYHFFTRSDDASRFYLNESGPAVPDPLAVFPIANEQDCCDAFMEPDAFDLATTQAPIALTAGQKYGFLFLVKEGGGGDWGQVAWRREGDSTPASQLSPIRGAFLEGVSDPVGASVTITQNPANATVAENQSVSFTVAASITSPYVTTPTYHWRRNGTPIYGAHGPTYTIPLVKKALAGTYDCVVMVPGANATSTAATLTVTDDTIRPTVQSVRGSDDFTTVIVVFSEPVERASAETVANYALSGGLTISAATLAAPNTVRLTTSRYAENTDYTLTINNVKDTAAPANTIAPNTQVAWHSFLRLAGIVKYERWNGIGGTGLQALRDDPRFPDNPDIVQNLTAFEAPIDTADNYGARLTALVIPPETGNYVFFISADDNAEFFLSDDASPANLHLVAREPQWNGARQWVTLDRRDPDFPENRSDRFNATEWPTGNTITLQAGRQYLAQLLFKEGGGGDNGAVFIKKASDPDPSNGAPAASGNILAWFIAPPSTLEITRQPQDVTTYDLLTASFSIQIQTDATIPPAFQWRRNGVDIPEATGSSYSLIASLADDGATFDCVVRIPGFPNLTRTSAAARLTVCPSVVVAGSLLEEFYSGANRAAVLNGRVGPPTSTSLWTTFEGPVDIADNYTRRVRGWFTPATSGRYVFFISADDDADLFLSTDASPANKRLIAQEMEWSAFRNWVTTGSGPVSQKRSDQWVPDPSNPPANPPFANGIPLTAGTRYYIEAVQREGGGGDNLAVTFKLLADPDPETGDPSAITSAMLSHPEPGQCEGVGLRIGSIALVGGNVRISWEGAGRLQSAPSINGPWSDVAGATSPYSVPPTGSQMYFRLAQ